MKDIDKSKEELVNEINELRLKISSLEAHCKQNFEERWSSLEQQVRKRTNELKSANEQLRHEVKERRQMEQILRRITENMLDVIVQTDDKGIRQYVSPSYQNVLGYDPNDTLGKSIFEQVHPSERDSALALFQSAVKNCAAGRVDFRFKHASGHYMWLETTGNPILDDNGIVTGAVFCCRDITKRKEAEEAVKKSEERFKLLIENASDIIAIIDAEGKLNYINPSKEMILGYRIDEAMKLNGFSYIHPEDIPFITKLFIQCLQSPAVPVSARLRVKQRDGGWRFFEVMGTNLLHESAVAGIVISGRDITGQKQAEEALRKSQERAGFLADVLERSSQPFSVVYPDGGIMTCNSAFNELVGYCMEELRTVSWFDNLTPSDWREYNLEVIREVTKTRKPLTFEKEYICKDGSRIPVELFIHPVTDNKGNIRHFYSFITDLTSRKQAEETLRKSEERFRLIIENSTDVITVINPDGDVLYGSPSTKRVLGYNPEDLVDDNMLKYIHPEDVLKVYKFFTKARQVEGANSPIEFRVLHKNSSWVFLESIGHNLLHVPGIEGLVVNSRDITERKRYEKEMARLDRLKLIGQMAGGIGHEVRNPMTTVRGFLQMLGGKQEYAKDKEFFDLMISELDRANSIITEFLSVAKSKTDELESKNINNIIKSILPLIQADALNVSMDLKYDEGNICELLLDEREIRQLIFNLARNGFDVMAPGGILTIRTFMENDEIVLAVQDQGKGILPEIQEKLGTPFLTTKAEGTGLGLAICYSIANRHNATIEVNTGTIGTTFLVRFKI